MAKKIVISAELDRNSLINSINNTIKELEKTSKISFNIDKSTLSNIDSKINNIKDKMNSNFVIKEPDITGWQKRLDWIDNKIKDLNTKQMSNSRIFGDTNEVREINNEINDFISELEKMKVEGTNISDIKQVWTNFNTDLKQSIEILKNTKKEFDENINLANKMEEVRLKSQERVANENKKNELAQIQAINSALEQQKKEEQDLANAMAIGREKSQERVSKTNYKEELEQAKAINSALEENYRNKQKEAEEQEKVNNLLNQEVKRLEIVKQSLNRQYGNNIDTSPIDNMISKYKSIDNISMSKLRNDIKNNNLEIKQMTENAKESEGSLGKIGSALSNIGIYLNIGDAVRVISNSFKEASTYVETMDKHITNMMMITGKSKSEVEGIATQYKQLGADLHTTNTEMMAGAEELLRAGYSDSESQAMMKASILGSKISGQNVDETTQQLIAIKNAFDMTGESMQDVIDKITLMDAKSATSTAEISNAIQRTAYNAKINGTELNDLIAYITTMSEKTRLPAEKIGTGLSTIYSRYQNIKLGNLDDEGKSINDTEKAMSRIGIKIRDTKDKFRDFDDVLKEFMQKVQNGSISQVDMMAGVQALAGSRQKDLLLSLITNMDTLKQHQEDIVSATGNAEKMFNEAYGNSMDAKLQDLKRSFEGLYESMLNSKVLGLGVSGLTSIVNLLSNGTVRLTAFVFLVSSLGKTKFGTKIASELKSVIDNLKTATKEGTLLKTTLGSLSKTQLIFGGLTIGLGIFDAIYNKIKENKEEMQKFNEETVKGFSSSNQNIAKAENLLSKKTDLESQINDSTLTTSQQLSLKNDLVEVEKQLAEILPDSNTGYNDQNELISENTKLIEQQIQAKKDEIKANAEKVITNNSRDGFEDLYQQIQEARALKATIDEMNSVKKNNSDNFNVYRYDRLTDETNIENDKFDNTTFKNNLNNRISQLNDYKKRFNEIKASIQELQNQGVDNGEISDLLGMSQDSFDYAINQLEVVKEEKEDTSKTPIFSDEDNEKIKLLSTGLKELQTQGNISENTLRNFSSVFDDVDMAGKNTQEQMEFIISTIEKMGSALNNGDYSSGAKLYTLTSALTQLQRDGDLTSDSILRLSKVLPDLDLANMSAEERVKALTEAINEQKKAIDNESQGDIKKAQGQLLSVATELEKINKYQKQLSENGGKITSDLLKDFTDEKNGSFTDFMGNPEDINQVTEYFKNKMQELSNSHAQAMDIINGNSESYFQNIQQTGDFTNEKVREWASGFIDVNSQAYTFDLNNYSNMNQAKQGMLQMLKERFAQICSSMTGIGAEEYMKDMENYKTMEEAKVGVTQELQKSVATFLSNVLGGSADSYIKDFGNYKSLNEAKIGMLNELEEKIQIVMKNEEVATEQLAFMAKTGMDKTPWGDTMPKYEAVQEMLEYFKKTEQQLKDEKKTIEDITLGDIDRNLDSFGDLGNIDTNNGKIDNNTSSKDKNNKTTQKSISLIKDEVDRYKDLTEVIEKYKNANNQLDVEKENKDTTTKNNLLRQEIRNYNELTKANINLRNAENTRFNELHNILVTQGFEFDKEGKLTTNYTKRLNQLMEQFNNDMKANADVSNSRNEQWKQINSWVNEYLELLESKLPDVNREISDINNKIIDIRKEILTNQANDYLDVEQKKYDEFDKAINKAKEDLEKLHDEMNKQDELADKQNAVDKAQEALLKAERVGDSELIKKRTEELEKVQKELNNTNADQNYEAQTKRLDDESKAMSERMDKIKDALSDDNLLKMAQNGIDDLSSTLRNLDTITGELPESFSSIQSYTYNISNEMDNWIKKIDQFTKSISNISNINFGNNINSLQARRMPIINIGDIKSEYNINGASQDIINELQRNQNDLANNLKDTILNTIGEALSNGNY